MNFAEYKYRNILAKDGGPIEDITYNIYSNFEGHNYFAKLKSNLLFTTSYQNLKLYNSGGGQGSSFTSKLTAYYKSISEALEYWAFYDVKNNFSESLKEKYGFFIDSTSNGFACYPGILSRSTRKFALLEAIERWSIIAWWCGKLPVTILDSSITKLVTPWPNVITVIMKSKSLIHNRPIYAFATELTTKDAIEHAKLELYRNSRVIDNCYSNQIINLQSIMEKRILYFSTNEGEIDFLEKLNQSTKLIASPLKPKLLIDVNIPGPWNDYANIWRCLFEPVTDEFLNSSNEKFFFF